MKLLHGAILLATLACIADPSKGATLARINTGLTTKSDVQARSQNIYVANDSGQDIYVMATLNPDWALADFVIDMSLLGIAFVKMTSAIAAAADLTLNTPRDLFSALQIAAQFLSGAASAANHGMEGAQALVDAFKNTSTPIADGDFKDVYRESTLSTYLTPDGIAGLLGARTVSLMIMSGDGEQVAMWNTGPDNSWIATNTQQIVRSKYGTIWQQDPSSGTENWPVGNSSAASVNSSTSSNSQPTSTPNAAATVMKAEAAWVGALAGFLIALL